MDDCLKHEKGDLEYSDSVARMVIDTELFMLQKFTSSIIKFDSINIPYCRVCGIPMHIEFSEELKNSIAVETVCNLCDQWVRAYGL
jgi:hypothetical protein